MVDKTKGILMFAHNNAEVDYVAMASLNANLIKHNLNLPVALVTDRHSWQTTKWTGSFSELIMIEGQTEANQRIYKDGVNSTQKLEFLNSSRYNAYDLSPFDETIVIDSDYLIFSDKLNQCWGSTYNILINDRAEEILHSRKTTPEFIDDFSIRMYWATVVYFNRSPEAEQMFRLVGHVREHYQYYCELYSFPYEMFRNDFAFSVALHMLNSYQDHTSFSSLPGGFQLISYDTDDIYKVHGPNDITMLADKQNGESILVRITDHDLHIINKWALMRNLDNIAREFIA